jgi:hypothetical protein
MAKPRTHLDVSQQRYCVSAKAYFFFFLAVFFFAFFAFLAMVPSVFPKLSSMQVEHRRAGDSVHHNRKIDTACFEQGKRRSHHCECTTISRDAQARAIFILIALIAVIKFRPLKRRCNSLRCPLMAVAADSACLLRGRMSGQNRTTLRAFRILTRNRHLTQFFCLRLNFGGHAVRSGSSLSTTYLVWSLTLIFVPSTGS